MSKRAFLFALLILSPALLRAEDLIEAPSFQASPSDVDFLYPTCVAAIHLDAAGVPYRVLVVATKTHHYEASCLFKVGKSTYSYGRGGSRIYYRSFETNPSVLTWPLPRQEVLQLARSHDSFPEGCLVDATASYYRRKRDPQVVWVGLINTAVTAGQEIVNTGFGINIVEHSAQGHSIDAFETTDHQIFVEENGDTPVKVRGGALSQGWHDATRLAQVLHKTEGSQSTFIDEFRR